MKYVSLNWSLIKSKNLHHRYTAETVKEEGIDFYKVALDPDNFEPVIVVNVTDKTKFLNFVATNDLTFKALEEGAPELGEGGKCMEDALLNWNM